MSRLKKLFSFAKPLSVAIAFSTSAYGAEVDTDRSLFIRDTPILNTISLSDVLQKLLDDAGDSAHTPQALLDLWPSRSAAGCDSNTPINGFIGSCSGVPFDNVGDYRTIAMTNRFDLAPADGAHCGEYRIAFALERLLISDTQVNFIIFEARMPNPHPDQGLEGCRPVANFWASLSEVDDIATRAAMLRGFYFDGIDGFPAVVNVNHYQGADNGSGQIRINQRNSSRGPSWSFFEFATSAADNLLTIERATLKDTPSTTVLNGTAAPSLIDQFENTLLAAISVPGENLLADNMSKLAVGLPEPLNKGSRNTTLNTGGDTELQRNFDTDGDFADALAMQLQAVGSTLTPSQVIARANALTCGGCHNQGSDLGDGLVFDTTNQFAEMLNTRPAVGDATHIEAEAFAQMSGVQTETTTDTGGGLNVGWLDAGDWLTYDLPSPTNSGNNRYRIEYRIAGMTAGELRLERPGGGQVWGTQFVPATGDWQAWQSVTQFVEIPAGETQLAIAVNEAGWNLNWFKITPIEGEQFALKPALADVFLPQRKTILEDFLSACENCQANLLSNGSFANNGEGWQTYIDQSANAFFILDDAQGGARLTSIFGGTEIWHAQVYQGGLSLEAGKTYRLQFEGTTYGKSTHAQYSVHVEENGGAYTQYMPAVTVSVNPGIQTFEITFTAQQTVNNARVTFNMGKNHALGSGFSNVFGVDNVHLFEVF